MSPEREQATARMELAKAKFTRAAKAALAADPGADVLTREAVRDVEEARAALRALEGDQ